MASKWKLARVGKSYSFSAAHYLTGVPESHPCAKMHGHNYRVEAEVRGEIHPHTGFVVDFAKIDEQLDPVIAELDHSLLNDLVKNPTAENIALWILDNVKCQFFFGITVWETDRCWAQVIRSDGMFRRGHRE